jgi:tetratricopeptide (TPR) repeat protein
LLAYLVEREQAGEAERLKGYTIAVDVFGRDQEFDSSTDAVVRVQAGRLRELLSQYYESEGRDDPMRIVVTRGSYVPTYEKTAAFSTTTWQVMAEKVEPGAPQAVEATRQASADEPRRPDRTRAAVGVGQVRLLWAALAVIAGLLLIVLERTMSDSATSGGNVALASNASAQTASSVELAPSETLPTIRIVTDGNDPAVTRVARLLRTALAGFETLDLIGGEYSRNDGPLPPDPAGFVLSVASSTPGGDVLLELQSLGSGKVLINRRLSALQTISDSLQNEVASLVNAVAPVNGAIYGYVKQNGLQSDLVNCLILNNAYYLEWTERRHLAAYRCFEKLIEARAQSPLVYAALASLRTSAKMSGYSYPASLDDQDTLALARRAVQLGPTTPYAYATMGYLYSQRGDSAEAVQWLGKAYGLNTFDISVAAAYGYTLVLQGRYADGAKVLQRAVEVSSVHPPWWDFTLFLADFMLGDTDKAARAARALSTAKKPEYLAARLIAAHSFGDERHADALATELAGSFPKFASDPAHDLRKENFPTDLVDRFVDALRRAGIGSAS